MRAMLDDYFDHILGINDVTIKPIGRELSLQELYQIKNAPLVHAAYEVWEEASIKLSEFCADNEYSSKTYNTPSLDQEFTVLVNTLQDAFNKHKAVEQLETEALLINKEYGT